MSSQAPAIVGLGYCVPSQVRTNDDPIFDWLKTNQPKYVADFQGFNERRVLAENETLVSIMTAAAQAAMEDARVSADGIDLLLGLGSVGDLISPNALVACHRALKLGAQCRIIPLASEFTVFNDAVLLADALLRAGRDIRNILVVCGCDWSRHVSYHEAPCIGAADGAGAALLSLSDDARLFRLVDAVAQTDTSYYGAMRMAAREAGVMTPPPAFCPTLFSTPLMYFGDEAQKAYHEFGGKVPSKLVLSLLARSKIAPADICLIAHQASTVLTQAWQAAIKPRQLLTTLPEFANMTLASVPVTLASLRKEIETDFLVLLTLGMQQQASALLFARASREAPASATSVSTARG